MVAVAVVLVCVCVFVGGSGGAGAGAGAGLDGVQVVLELGELMVEQDEGETAVGQ